MEETRNCTNCKYCKSYMWGYWGALKCENDKDEPKTWMNDISNKDICPKYERKETIYV